MKSDSGATQKNSSLNESAGVFLTTCPVSLRRAGELRLDNYYNIKGVML
jgi:hypothetical protein